MTFIKARWNVLRNYCKAFKAYCAESHNPSRHISLHYYSPFTTQQNFRLKNIKNASKYLIQIWLKLCDVFLIR